MPLPVAPIIPRVSPFLMEKEMFLNEVSTGASDDFKRATRLARSMVTEYGMSDLGPVQYEEKQEGVFLGRDYSKSKNFSDQVALEIDQQTRKIIEENLIENHIKYANNENIMLQGREQIRKIKKLLQEERSNAGAQKTVVEPSEGENYSIIALIGYSEEEFKLEQELIKLNGTQAQIKDKLDYLSRRTYELSRQLEEIDRQIKAGSIYAGIKARLDKLNLRIAHAKKIYEMSSVDEDESNK